MDFSTYLFYIYKKFGRTVFNQVLDDVGTITLQKTLTLEELHIYGSSRHGIKKPKSRLVAKIYDLDEIESDGEFAYNNPTDSAILKVNYHYFKRTLTYKQYELTNHLGNVLATISDRKTAHINSGSVDYYEADVTTAQMYYAFGSAIKELSYAYSSGGDTSKYRYGFNNQEKDGELGEYYAFEHRIHDARLARFLSVDPVLRDFPILSTYQHSSNNPIYNVDWEGLEGVAYFVNVGFDILLDNSGKRFKDRIGLNISSGVSAVSGKLFASNSISYTFSRNSKGIFNREVTNNLLAGYGDNLDWRHDVNFMPRTSTLYQHSMNSPNRGFSFGIGYQFSTQSRVRTLYIDKVPQRNFSGFIGSIAYTASYEYGTSGLINYNGFSSGFVINNLFVNKPLNGFSFGLTGFQINDSKPLAGSLRINSLNSGFGLDLMMHTQDFKVGVFKTNIESSPQSINTNSNPPNNTTGNSTNAPSSSSSSLGDNQDPFKIGGLFLSGSLYIYNR